MSSPRFEPWLIPDTTSSASNPSIRPSRASRTQSTGVPSVAYPTVPSPKSTSCTHSGRRVVIDRAIAERLPSGAITASSIPGSASSARRSACSPAASIPSSFVSRTRIHPDASDGPDADAGWRRGAANRNSPSPAAFQVTMRRRRLVALLATLVPLAVAFQATPASATYKGRNGELAWESFAGTDNGGGPPGPQETDTVETRARTLAVCDGTSGPLPCEFGAPSYSPDGQSSRVQPAGPDQRAERRRRSGPAGDRGQRWFRPAHPASPDRRRRAPGVSALGQRDRVRRQDIGDGDAEPVYGRHRRRRPVPVDDHRRLGAGAVHERHDRVRQKRKHLPAAPHQRRRAPAHPQRRELSELRAQQPPDRVRPRRNSVHDRLERPSSTPGDEDTGLRPDLLAGRNRDRVPDELQRAHRERQPGRARGGQPQGPPRSSRSSSWRTRRSAETRASRPPGTPPASAGSRRSLRTSP